MYLVLWEIFIFRYIIKKIFLIFAEISTSCYSNESNTDELFGTGTTGRY